MAASPQHARRPDGADPPHAGGAARSIVLGDALHRSGRAGHGLLLLAMALPAGLPVPLSSLPAGLGLVIGGTRLISGARRPWLPGMLRRLRVRRAQVRAGLRRLTALLRRLRLRPRPRFAALTGPAGHRLAGVSGLFCGVVVLLPLPFANQPAALAAAALGLGLLRRDGAIVLAGHGLTLAAVTWACFLLLAGHRLVAWTSLLLWR